jgi:hypothetical protein
MGFAQNYHSNVALFIRATPLHVAVVRIGANGLLYETFGADAFNREFNRDLLMEEWSALTKFLAIAMRNDGNDHLALVTLMKGFEMKLQDLKGKTMEELVSMHNELATAKGAPTVEKFKSVEAGRIAVVKLAKVATNGAKTVEAKKATGKGAEGRPRSGVGVFAKEQLLKGGSNSEVLEVVKKKFPNNSTSLSCIAYYRNALVKEGLLQGGRQKKSDKSAKPVKGAKAKAKKAKEPAPQPAPVQEQVSA